MINCPDLRGRTVALTGAARGIGRALIGGLTAQGLNLILLDYDGDGLDAAVAAAQCADCTVQGVVCDLADPQQRARAAAEIGALTLVLDGIVHNAAIDPRRPLAQTTLQEFRRVMATNVEPALELTRDLLPNLCRSAAPRVVHIGSVTFEIGTALLGSYVASKGALVGLTRSLAHELGVHGITVNCLAPGVIQVEKEAAQMTPELLATILDGQSVHRLLTPADLLGPLCLLLSDAGSAISGQTITVDGGMLPPLAALELQSRFLTA